MVKIRSFMGYRPTDAERFTVPPYDVIDDELAEELRKIPDSAVHIILPEGEGKERYINASNILQEFIRQGILRKDDCSAIYLYREESEEHTQEGIIAGVSVDDYLEGNIKRHEITREMPLKDRIEHIGATGMNTGPVWLIHRWDDRIQKLIEVARKKEPVADFEKLGYRHILWKICDPTVIKGLRSAFKKHTLYIADGHHRAAASVKYTLERRKKIRDYTGAEPWNYFMAFICSDEQVRILPYHRVIAKLPMGKDEFLGKIMENFTVEVMENRFVPRRKHEIGMFLGKTWYKLHPKQTFFDSITDSLDVAILQRYILEPILGIRDIRNDPNISFVGGITDPAEMEKYVTEKGYAVFFALYGVSVADLEDIADAGEIMPPKSTWFDPKLLSGLVFYPLDDSRY